MAAQLQSALPAIFINGQPIASAQCPALPSEMLLGCEKGPYTTAAVSHDARVQALDRHITRLAEAVLALHRDDPASFAKLCASLNVSCRAQLIFQWYIRNTTGCRTPVTAAAGHSLRYVAM